MGVTLNIWGEICKTIGTSTPTWWKDQIDSHNNITNKKGALSNIVALDHFSLSLLPTRPS